MTSELMETVAISAFALGVLLSVVAFVGMLVDECHTKRWPFRMCAVAFLLVLLAQGLHQSNAPAKDADGAVAEAIKAAAGPPP